MNKKRKVVQSLSALLMNAHLAGLVNGSIWRGASKAICVPGLNCYSCPAALFACPLGSLQAALGDIRYKLPLYICGLLLLFGAVLGRAVCAFLCPFGFIQEMLHKIPSPKILKNTLTQRLTTLKYLVLALFVLALPLGAAIGYGTPLPAFCSFLCPVGTLEGGIPLALANASIRDLLGLLFAWRVLWLFGILLACILCYRAFCRFLCPLGAIYSLFNRWALWKNRMRPECIGCGNCAASCSLDVQVFGDHECLLCGDCVATCSKNQNGVSLCPSKRT